MLLWLFMEIILFPMVMISPWYYPALCDTVSDGPYVLFYEMVLFFMEQNFMGKLWSGLSLVVAWRLLEHFSYWERLRQLWLFSLEKRKLRTNPVNVYKFLIKGTEDERGRLFSVAPSDRTRGNGHLLKIIKFHQNMRKHFFAVSVVKHWNTLWREVVEWPSVAILKTQLDSLAQPVISDLAWTRALD